MFKIYKTLIGFFLIFFYFSSVNALEKPEVFIQKENSKMLLDEFSFVSGNFTNYLIVYSPKNNGVYFVWKIASTYVDSIPLETLKKDSKILEDFLFYLKGLNYAKKKLDNDLNIDIGVSNEPQHSKDGKLTAKIIPYQGKKIISLVRTSDNKELAKLFIFKNTEWIILTPAGYYSSSDVAGKYLNVRIGDKVYKMEDFEKVFYRPEIVEAALEGKAISELKFPNIKLPDIKKEKKYNIIIEEVLSDFPFEKAGGKIWDFIYSLNGKTFYESSNKDLTKEFSEYIKSLPAGSYEMTLIREGRKITTTINLSEISSTPRMGITSSSIENNPQFYFNKAIELLKNAKSRKDIKIVAQLLEIAKALSPEWADVYYNLGLVYEELTYYDKAAENFSKYVNFVKDKYSVEAKNVTFRIEENRKKHEKLEYIKKRMVEGELHYGSENIPIHGLPPIFKFDKAGKMWMLSPFKDRDRRKKKYGWVTVSGPDRPLPIENKNAKNFPMFPVLWDGRFFEVRYFVIWEGENIRSGPFFFVYYVLIKGEIDLSSSNAPIITTEYQQDLHNDKFKSFEEAGQYASQKIKAITFDERKDLRGPYVIYKIK
jgi:tetratricopeptide (TPR) repeat protein